MEANETEADELEFGGSPQAGEQAGEQATSDNDGEHLEDSHNDDELPDDEPDDDEPDPDSDETDDDEPAVARARQQAARYRRQLRDVESERDELAEALWLERVTALGTLADPTDLPFDPDALHDPDRLRELADELVTRKPHLRSRRIRARAGQGEGTHEGGVNLAAMLARGA